MIFLHAALSFKCRQVQGFFAIYPCKVVVDERGHGRVDGTGENTMITNQQWQRFAEELVRHDLARGVGAAAVKRRLTMKGWHA